MDTIKKVTIKRVSFNGIDYYRAVFLDQESQLYSRREINDILDYWAKDELLGSFAIGYKLDKKAVIDWI